GTISRGTTTSVGESGLIFRPSTASFCRACVVAKVPTPPRYLEGPTHPGCHGRNVLLEVIPTQLLEQRDALGSMSAAGAATLTAMRRFDEIEQRLLKLRDALEVQVGATRGGLSRHHCVLPSERRIAGLAPGRYP